MSCDILYEVFSVSTAETLVFDVLGWLLYLTHFSHLQSQGCDFFFSAHTEWKASRP